MFDTAIAVCASNTILAAILAVIATATQRLGKHPHVARALWILTLVKLVTPPVISLPTVYISSRATVVETQGRPSDIIPSHLAGIRNAEQQRNSITQFLESTIIVAVPWMIRAWTLGSVYVFVVSAWRIRKFSRHLHVTSVVASSEVREVAQQLCNQLRLRRLPAILVTSARVTPMVWCDGRGTHVVIPQCMFEHLEPDDWIWVLAHELCHIRRRDHWVRLLEWWTRILFWWNPVAWWAQRNLRVVEEICCDEMVLSLLRPTRRAYAESILRVVDSLAVAIHPPVMACGIHSGGSLEERVRMILTRQFTGKWNAWPTALATLLGLCVIPLRLAMAQDVEAVSKRLETAVENHELSQTDAISLIEFLKKRSVEGNLNKLDAAKQKDGLVVVEEVVQTGNTIEGEVTNRESTVTIEDNNVVAKLQKLRAEFEAAVKAGDLTPEEAKRRMGEAMLQWKSENRSDLLKKKDVARQFGEAVAAFESAVKAGDADAVRHYSKVLIQGVEDGKPLVADVKEHIGAIVKKHVDEDARDHDKIRHLEEELKQAVKAGDLSEEEAKHRLSVVLKRKLIGGAGSFGESTGKPEFSDSSDELPIRGRVSAPAKQIDSADVTEEFAIRRKKILAAVDAGFISKEDAARLLSPQQSE